MTRNKQQKRALKQVLKGKLACDIALEIIYGCDLFDKYDIKAVCKKEGISLEDLRKLTEEEVKTNYSEGSDWTEDFLQRQLDYWFK